MVVLWILTVSGTALAEEPPPTTEPAPPLPAERPPEHFVRPPEPEGLVPDALEGTWWVVDDDRDRKIDELAKELPFYLRAMARTRLRSVTFPCDAVRIEEQGELISIACDDRLPAVGPPGKTVEYADGIRLTTVVSGDSLVQTFTRKDGVRRSVYTARDDGMRLEVTVRSPHLPRELVFERTFVRELAPEEPPGITEAAPPGEPPPGS